MFELEKEYNPKNVEEKWLALWLERYRLGELWTRGELGGTRW